jgi:hypothetical protein
MKKLDLKTTSEIIGGDWTARWLRQTLLCSAGTAGNRHCGRANRIYNRHQ